MRLVIACAAAAALAASALPATADEYRDAVVAMFAAQQENYCDTLMRGPEDMPEPIVNTLTYRYIYDSPDDPAREMTLYDFECTIGAYNVGHVFYTADEYGEIAQVHFATPAFDVINEDPDNYDSPVKEIRLKGFTAYQTLVFPEFDPETQSITNHSYWRGLGDASSSGTWEFQSGDFVLTEYWVDASYDDQINPERIYSAKD